MKAKLLIFSLTFMASGAIHAGSRDTKATRAVDYGARRAALQTKLESVQHMLDDKIRSPLYGLSRENVEKSSKEQLVRFFSTVVEQEQRATDQITQQIRKTQQELADLQKWYDELPAA